MQKIALIRVATGDLSQAIAKKLLTKNWRLILVSRDLDKLKATYGENHTQVIADCSSHTGVKHIFEVINANNLAPTALAHCVGNIHLGALHRVSEIDFVDCMTTNLFSAFIP